MPLTPLVMESIAACKLVFVTGMKLVIRRMETTRELERLWGSGVPFTITIGERGGFLVKLGYYLREASPTMEAATMEEAVNWLLAHVGFERQLGHPS